MMHHFPISLKLTAVLTILFSVNSFVYSQIALEDIWKYKYHPKHVSVDEWSKDGKMYYQTSLDVKDSSHLLYTYDAISEEILDTLLRIENRHGAIKEFRFNDDENLVAITHTRKPLYRRSVKEKVTIYFTGNKSGIMLNKGQWVYNPTFSPTDSCIAYTANNNLYYHDLKSMETYQITDNGEQGKIINGRTDWVYEEEFEYTKAFWWSPNSRYIAFLQFDESNVKEYFINFWNDEPYPETISFKYPKVGENNSKIKINLFDRFGENNISIFPPNDEEYVAKAFFSPDGAFIYYTLNREQNHLKIHRLYPGSINPQILYEEKNDTYVDYNNQPFFFEDGHFLLTTEKNEFKNVEYFNKLGKRIHRIKSHTGIVDLLHVDEKNELVYYTEKSKHGIEEIVVSNSFDGKNRKVLFDAFGYNTVSFSKNGSLGIYSHSSASSPPKFALYEFPTVKKVKTLEENLQLQKELEKLDLPTPEFGTVQTTFGDLNYFSIEPSHINREEKHPVLFLVYGGPGSQTVENRWMYNNFFWWQTLVERGYIIYAIDGAGTGGKSTHFKHQTYGQLGKLETQSINEAAKKLAQKEYIDSSRMGIWGWSYGGYLSARCLLEKNSIFKTAIAVAPVTDWRFYDNIYTERYMGLKGEDDRYDSSSLIPLAPNLSGNLLLVHGMADDNVHYQHTIMLQNALYRANKIFTTLSFPNKNHGIYGGNTRLYLYKYMTNFIEQNL